MLFTGTVESRTFEILGKLCRDARLNAFNLAGGTALALHLGHRLSIDLDMFSAQSFNSSELSEHLISEYGLNISNIANNTIKGYISDVKLDLITHAYPCVRPIVLDRSGIRLYSIQDIAAMKLNAISRNGTRLKDFVDIAAVSTRLSFREMLEAYAHKYPSSSTLIPLRAVNYFNDIDYTTPISIICGSYEWPLIEKRINNMIAAPDRIFQTLPFKHTRSRGLGI